MSGSFHLDRLALSVVVLIPWPETDWTIAGRMIGRSPVSLTSRGKEMAASWAQPLSSLGLRKIYSSSEKASIETAAILAYKLDAVRKQDDDLAEVDAGLWDGLTHEELARRYPKIYKRWCDDPTAVCPPEGEEIVSASDRLHATLDRVAHRKRRRNIAIVVGPTAFAVLRCQIEDVPMPRLLSMVYTEPLKYDVLDGVPGRRPSDRELTDGQSSIGRRHGEMTSPSKP